MKSVDVSVLICTYNQEKYIAQAIESILCQKTDYEFEIIIGDDASTDNTGKIVRDFLERYPHKIKAVRQNSNIGATRNCSEISKLAKGKYIATCDGDDCWDDAERIQKQVAFLENHENYSAICGRTRLMDEMGNSICEKRLGDVDRFWEYENDVFNLKDFENWKMPGHNSAILGRNVWLRYNPEILYKIHETVGDRTGILLYLLLGPIRCNNEVVSCYRIRKDDNHFVAQYFLDNLRDQDVEMMNNLERLAEEHGRKLDLSKMKKNRFVAAICAWLKSPTEKNLKVLKNIICLVDRKPEYMFLAVKTILLKLYYWKIVHRDIRIQLD